MFVHGVVHPCRFIVTPPYLRPPQLKLRKPSIVLSGPGQGDQGESRYRSAGRRPHELMGSVKSGPQPAVVPLTLNTQHVHPPTHFTNDCYFTSFTFQKPGKKGPSGHCAVIKGSGRLFGPQSRGGVTVYSDHNWWFWFSIWSRQGRDFYSRYRSVVDPHLRKRIHILGIRSRRFAICCIMQTNCIVNNFVA